MHRTPRWARTLPAVLVVGGLYLSGVSAAPAALPTGGSGPAQGVAVGPPRPGTIPSFTSRNWDGYITYISSHATDYTVVRATWTQPKVTCTQPSAWTVFWVGFDGWWNDTVEQGGTSVRCVNGKPQYGTWWEMYPTTAIQTVFAISPGNHIAASVTYKSATSSYIIVVKDVTTGRSFTKTEKCAAGLTCSRDSADVIAEDVGHYPGPGYFPLADYGAVSFTGVSITNEAGHTGSISSTAWDAAAITEASGTITYATTSALNTAGNGFTAKWRHA